MQYAVFIVIKGSWKLHGLFFNKADAVREKNYCIDMLGIKAEVFVK